MLEEVPYSNNPKLPNGKEQSAPLSDVIGGRHLFRRILRISFTVVLFLLFIRMLALEPYSIPTGSMQPTVRIGDAIIVNKLPYTIRTFRTIPFTDISIPHIELPGIGTLERGDVVMFEYDAGNRSSENGAPGERRYLKRCAAVAGDTVTLVNGKLLVNNTPVPLPPESIAAGITERKPIQQEKTAPELRYGREVIIPYKGYIVEIDSLTILKWRGLIESEGVSVEYRNRIVFLDSLPALRYTFKRDYFMALGDNSYNSYDSRFFGFVPYSSLIGRAMFVYWSREPEQDVRWGRMGTWIE